MTDLLLPRRARGRPSPNAEAAYHSRHWQANEFAHRASWMGQAAALTATPRSENSDDFSGRTLGSL